MISKSLQLALMDEAIQLARKAMSLGEVPIAAVVARSNGTIVGWGWNELNAKRDRTAHAEIAAFRDAAGRYSPEETDLILVSTLEPCVMCMGCAMLCGVGTIIFGLQAPEDSGLNRISPPTSPESSIPEVKGNIRREEIRTLFEEWLENHPEEDAQRRYVTQLLILS